MFGAKKAEDEVKPLAGYPSESVKNIKNALLNKVPHRISDVNWEKVQKIWIDKIRLNKDVHGGLEIYTKDDVTKEYIKAWRLGLGKFISKEWRKDEKLDRYKFIYFPKEEGYKGLVAFVRLIDETDFSETLTLDDLKKYKCISFDYTDKALKKPIYVSVMKIFVKSDKVEDEQMLSEYNKISNVDDEYYSDGNEFYSSLFTPLVNNIDDEPKPVKTKAVSVPKDEYVNQDNLF